jgi:glycosidase
VRKPGKARFCANDQGTLSSILATLDFNRCALGIPCIYYGTEQSFDGRGYDDNQDFKDRWIREAMFGGTFVAFRTKDVHFFDQISQVYQGVAKIAAIRQQEPTLRRGRQYLLEISAETDGNNYGLPTKYDEQMRSLIPWSRILSDTEILCSINTDVENPTTAWVTVDRDLHLIGDEMGCLYSSDGVTGGKVQVEGKNGRLVVKLTLPKGGFVIYK